MTPDPAWAVPSAPPPRPRLVLSRPNRDWALAGACVASVTGGSGLLAGFLASAPSEPCLPDSDCGWDPMTMLAVCAALLAAAFAAGAWAVFWLAWDQRLRFRPPPGWGTPPEGWTPHDSWEPPAHWPQPPDRWRFWA
jgi:hypothetical protein